MIDLHCVRLDPAQRLHHGLPDADYWSRSDDRRLLGRDLALPISALLGGAQLRSSADTAGWRSLEAAMDRLSEIMAAGSALEELDARGEGWSLELGPVDLASTIVTIQRDDDLIAAIERRPDGSLKATTFRPLDADSCQKLIGLGVTPAEDGTVCMRPDNWEYARDSSAGMGQVYNADQGYSYLSYWEFGLGTSATGDRVPPWYAHREAIPRLASLTYAELSVYCASKAAP